MILNLKSQLQKPTRLVANWMGWFKGPDGSSHRANVCHSDNPQTIWNQCLAWHACGGDGWVVDWYGGDGMDRAKPTDVATKILAQTCKTLGQEFSIMLDKGAFKYAPQGQQRWLAFNQALQYIRSQYIPLANYTQVNGKPVVWEFSWAENGINIQQAQLANPDLLILTQSRMAGGSGTYGWINGFPPSSPAEYLTWYLKHSQDPVMVPVLFDQFNDTNPADPAHGIWDKTKPPRIIQPGQLQLCLDLINQTGKTFPLVQHATWNDYDEGSNLEPEALKLANLKLT